MDAPVHQRGPDYPADRLPTGLLGGLQEAWRHVRAERVELFSVMSEEALRLANAGDPSVIDQRPWNRVTTMTLRPGDLPYTVAWAGLTGCTAELLVADDDDGRLLLATHFLRGPDSAARVRSALHQHLENTRGNIRACLLRMVMRGNRAFPQPEPLTSAHVRVLHYRHIHSARSGTTLDPTRLTALVPAEGPIEALGQDMRERVHLEPVPVG